MSRGDIAGALVETDWHSGHRLGLCNPDTRLRSEDGSTVPVVLTQFQSYLWALRQSHLDNVKAIIGKRRILYLHGGDVTHGNGHMDQLMSQRISDQFAIAADCAKPVLDTFNVAAVRLVLGTTIHEFGEGSSPDILANQLATAHPKLDVGILGHGRLRVGQVVLDIAHHGPPPGSKTWLKGNVARSYLLDRMMMDLQAGLEPAKVYIRGHYHEHVHETYRLPWAGQDYESHLVVVPAQCGLGYYATKATRSAPVVTNGLLLLTWGAAGLRVTPMVKTVDTRTEEVL